MPETLAEAIDDLSSVERGLHFTSGKEQSFINYCQLGERVKSLARKIVVVGGEKGQPIILMFADQAEFVQGFLSVVRAGLIAVPVPPPNLTENREEHALRVERIRQMTGARFVFTSDALARDFQPLLPNAQFICSSEMDAVDEKGELPRILSSDLALIQFTSGSTAAPKGVSLTHRNVVANGNAIKLALEVDPERDRGVSWLPMHHDMGLIGFLITPILTQTSIWYLPPMEFARRPHRWLELIDQARATISFAPNFGYDLVARRLRDSDAGKWDLSCWRIAGCGGEPVLANVLDKFADVLQLAKFNKTAFAPSYGLAEATLAVTVSPLYRGRLTRKQGGDNPYNKVLVSSGRPVTDTQIRIVSTSGTVLPDGQEGEVQVRGPGVAAHFWNESGICDACNTEGWLNTGDLGVLIQGELHVSGRIKDVVALNGCKYHPCDIEECVQDIEGVRRGNVVAFGRPGIASEQLVLMVETKLEGNVVDLKKKLRTCVRERLGLSVADVVAVGRGTISRTTSGKIQRSAMRSLYLSDFINKNVDYVGKNNQVGVSKT